MSIKIGYLGPEGSYSQLAALKFFPDGNLKAYGSFYELFDALSLGECAYIAVPIENSLQGAVLQNIDLMQEEDVCAVKECVVEIDHRLATLKGAPLKGIKRIYSHQQALAQCGSYLKTNFPGAELIASPSTSASLSLIKDFSEAGIVGAHAAAEGFWLSPQNIADVKPNLTHFLLVKKGGVEMGVKSNKIFFSATCRHRPGELMRLLRILSDGGLNMTKIESRPIKAKPGEYRFFIELDGDYSNPAALQTLENLKKASDSLKILGAY